MSESKGRKSNFRKVQRIGIWVLIVFTFATIAIIVVNVFLRGDSIARNQISDTNPHGKTPLLLDAPQWQLTDAFGKPASNKDFLGKVVVYDFIFTRCALVCPVMSMRMAELQNTFKNMPNRDDLNFISISIDGEYDTPQVLRKYAYDPEVGVGADPEVWHFMTGKKSVVWPLVEQQFKLPVEAQPEVQGMPIAHSAKFVLADKQGRIYNIYDPYDAQDRNALIADIEKLLRK